MYMYPGETVRSDDQVTFFCTQQYIRLCVSCEKSNFVVLAPYISELPHLMQCETIIQPTGDP